MTDDPSKPESVPADAWWDPDDNEWVLGERNAEGRQDGEYRYWRPDGTLCCRNRWVDGTLQGPFERYHENGDVSQRGEFRDGELDGTREWIGSDEPTSENTRPSGVSERVWRSEMDYVDGQVVAVRHFDREGRQVMPETGEPYPDRPDGVPPEAEYHPRDEQWAHGRADGNQDKQGLWRYWHSDGAKKREIEYLDDVPHGVFRGYDAAGTLRQEGTLEHGDQVGLWRDHDESGELESEAAYVEGVLDGPFKLFGTTVSEGYATSGAARLEGEYQRGAPVGIWRVTDGLGNALFEVSIGRVRQVDDLASLTPFANRVRSANEWQEQALELIDESRFVEALLCMARAVATSCEVEVMLDALQRFALPTTSERAMQVHGELAEAPVPTLASSLVLGASPAHVLRGLAIQLDQANYGHAALDMVNAAILLDPDERAFLFTRALILMRLGLNQHAAIDIEELAATEPEQAKFLRVYNEILFPSFDFWPSREPPETYYDELPEAPAQELEAIRSVIRKYVRRLTLIREALAGYVSTGMEWFPPDLSHLVAEDVALEVDQFEQTDEEGDVEEIEIDETLDTVEAELPDLLRWARSEWNALTYLCWAVGLDEVAIPDSLRPRTGFGEAAGMAVQRLWRCRDRRMMGGYGAQRAGVPGFEWEGLDVDEIPPQLISIAESQYAEMSAMFRWLTDGEARSPWQDNLRGS